MPQLQSCARGRSSSGTVSAAARLRQERRISPKAFFTSVAMSARHGWARCKKRACCKNWWTPSACVTPSWVSRLCPARSGSSAAKASSSLPIERVDRGAQRELHEHLPENDRADLATAFIKRACRQAQGRDHGRRQEHAAHRWHHCCARPALPGARGRALMWPPRVPEPPGCAPARMRCMRPDTGRSPTCTVGASSAGAVAASSCAGPGGPVQKSCRVAAAVASLGRLRGLGPPRSCAAALQQLPRTLAHACSMTRSSEGA